MDIELVRAIFSIMIIDLVLSGDNAVVIGMASRRLPPDQQRRAIIFGAGGAIGLRILFTAMITLLLDIPLLQAGGGVLLIWIAYKLLRQEHEEQQVEAGSSLGEAVRTIILADVIMSLDNILAVGGAAHGNLALLLFGLALSMPIILFGSGLVAALMNRLPWLVYFGSAILVFTAVEMILEDRRLGDYFPHERWFAWGAMILLTGLVLSLGYWRNVRRSSVGAPTRPGPDGGHRPEDAERRAPVTGVVNVVEPQLPQDAESAGTVSHR